MLRDLLRNFCLEKGEQKGQQQKKLKNIFHSLFSEKYQRRRAR